MSVIDLRRRLDRIEASNRTGAPTGILANRPFEDEEAPVMLANWQVLVAQGRASLSGNVLCILEPEMTLDEWAERHVAPH